jgi:hypothetical protein
MITINFKKDNVQIDISRPRRFQNSSIAALIYFILAIVWTFACDSINNKLILFIAAIPTLLSFIVFAILIIKESNWKISKIQEVLESQEVK